MPSWLQPESIVLGLDLQGGAHLLYEVDRADVVKSMAQNLRDDLRRLLREEKVGVFRRHRRECPWRAGAPRRAQRI